MATLITGAMGFIGSHLADYLREQGHTNLVSIDNLCSGKLENNPDILNFNADLANFDKVLEIFEQVKPDYVFHLGAVSQTPWAVQKPLEANATNVTGSLNVLEAYRRTNVKKVVLASSNIVYASSTLYRSTKLAMELHAEVYSTLYNLPTVCLRFSTVAGSKRQHENNVLAALAKSKRETGRITITGDGSQTRNFTYVMDVCEALWLASQSDVRGTELDIMHTKTSELNEIAKMYDCPIDYIEDRKGDIKHLKMGIGPEKAKELIGFEAKTDLTEYIKVYTE